MRILNTRDARELREKIKELEEFCREHSMTIYEMVELARQLLDVDLTSSCWKSFVIKKWFSQ